MAHPNTHPEVIVDKNGKKTTVHKKNDVTKSQGRVTAAPAPAPAVKEPAPSPVEQLADKIRKGEHWYTLHYVDYDEKLDNDQINSYLSGDESLDEQLLDNYSDQIYDRAEELAKEEAEEAGLDWEDLDWEDQSELRQAIQESENPQSDLLGDLLRNTPKQLLRHDLNNADDMLRTWITDEVGHPDLEKINETARGQFADYEKRKEVIAGELARYGISTESESNAEALETLVNEGPYDWHDGVKLSVIWYDDIENSRACNESGEVRELTFSGKANLLLIDTWSGSGYEAEFEVDSLSVQPSPDNPVFVDSSKSEHGGTYGWDDTAGVVKSAYENSPTPGSWHKG